MITRRAFAASTPRLAGGPFALCGCPQTPAVDPDNHHIFVSLGCATENLIQAAFAHGLRGDAQFDELTDAVRVTLEPVRARTTVLFKAIALRQCTRGDYDGKPQSGQELALLQRAGSSDKVRLLQLTELSAMEQTLDYVIHANTAQLDDAVRMRDRTGCTVCPPLAAALGFTGQRPNLVVRFGLGPLLPRSLRRPVEAVLV